MRRGRTNYKLPPEWTPKRLLALKNSGASYAEIVELVKVKVTRQAIMYHVKRARAKQSAK